MRIRAILFKVPMSQKEKDEALIVKSENYLKRLSDILKGTPGLTSCPYRSNQNFGKPNYQVNGEATKSDRSILFGLGSTKGIPGIRLELDLESYSSDRSIPKLCKRTISVPSNPDQDGQLFKMNYSLKVISQNLEEIEKQMDANFAPKGADNYVGFNNDSYSMLNSKPGLSLNVPMNIRLMPFEHDGFDKFASAKSCGNSPVKKQKNEEKAIHLSIQP